MRNINESNTFNHHETIVDDTINGIKETTVYTINNYQVITVIQENGDDFEYVVTNYRNKNEFQGFVETYDEAKVKISEKLQEIKV